MECSNGASVALLEKRGTAQILLLAKSDTASQSSLPIFSICAMQVSAELLWRMSWIRPAKGGFIQNATATAVCCVGL